MDSNYWSRHGETPFGRAMWAPRTAPPARGGTDPERDESSNSVSSESILTSAQPFSEPIYRPASQTAAVAECDRRPDGARSKLLAGLAHALPSVALRSAVSPAASVF